MNLEYVNIVNKSILYKSRYYRVLFRPVCIAVLDTGVFKHLDIASNIVGFKDFIGNKSDAYDDNGHGTHIAGIIAGNGSCSYGKIHGINEDANIYAIKVLDKYGNGKINNFVDAIDYVIKYAKTYNIKIINISLGGGHSLMSKEERKLVNCVEKAWTYGITVVVAAGNNGPSPGSVTIPGISRKVITVGSSETFVIDGTKKRYSGVGPTNQCIIKPDVKVPGNNIISLSNKQKEYISKSGTSMSAPIVSGLISILLEYNQSLTPKDIKKKLLNSTIYSKNSNKTIDLDMLFN